MRCMGVHRSFGAASDKQCQRDAFYCIAHTLFTDRFPNEVVL